MTTYTRMIIGAVVVAAVVGTGSVTAQQGPPFSPRTIAWGTAGDIPVPGDYDGDGRMDPAVYRPSTGNWYVLLSKSEYQRYATWGWGDVGDVQVPGDYSGLGRMEIAVYRPTTGEWLIMGPAVY